MGQDGVVHPAIRPVRMHHAKVLTQLAHCAVADEIGRELA